MTLSAKTAFSRLDPKYHDRAAFDCGVEPLNHYLQRFAKQDEKRGLSRVYVLSEGSRIVGYYTLSALSVSRDQLPPDIAAGPYADLPFVLLGRLAVDQALQGQGYGDALIAHAFLSIRSAAELLGILGIVVDAKDEGAAKFYAGFGFKTLQGADKRLVLSLSAMPKT